MAPPADYPPAPETDLVELMHGVPVADPFRTLEQADDPRTRVWVDAENALTRRALDGGRRDRFVERLRDLHRSPRASVPSLRGRRLFFTEHDGTRNQPVLYAWPLDEHTRTVGAGQVLVDPNRLDADGTTAVTAFEPDERGTRVVYALSSGGSDEQELRVHDVGLGRDLPDRLHWVKFASLAWLGDGFFYTRFPARGDVAPGDEQYFCQVRYHRLGDPQEADRLIHHRPDRPEVVFDLAVTGDRRHLVIVSQQGASDNAEVHLVALKEIAVQSKLDGPRGAAAEDAPTDARAIVTGFADAWHFIDGRDGRLYFRTDCGAPRGRIVRVDADGAAGGEPIEIVAESGDKIALAAIAGGHLLVSYLHDASDRLERFSLEGGPQGAIALPGLGSLLGVAACWDEAECAATFTSFTAPPQIIRLDLHAGRSRPLTTIRLPFDANAYTTEQVWYPSKDGTRVSMFLVRRAGGSGPGPVLLTGYGGFNVSLTPSFDPSDLVWLDGGGVVAVANLRGGGEYGEAWHRAGMRERKQNVFDDFIAAAEWLLASGVAAPGRIAIEGASNGGLLVAAVLVQRPDLFGAVICRVPVADMLRYHLFTVGRFWIPEYGCADDRDAFAYLHRLSPYHNVRDGVAYPPTLVMTADTDDRVAPGMAKKFAARLQQASTGGPVLLRVETRAGHGAGKSIVKQIEEQADMCEFLSQYLTRGTASEQERRPTR